MVTGICGWCGDAGHVGLNCAHRMAYEKRDRWAELAIAIENAARELDAAGQDGDALRGAFATADEERKTGKLWGVHEQSETVTTTDALRFVRARIREAGGSPEQVDGIHVAVNPTDPTVVDITIPMSPVTVYSAVILAKTPEATERVVNVLRDAGYDVSGGAPVSAVTEPDPLVAKMRERGMSDEQIIAALNANREL